MARKAPDLPAASGAPPVPMTEIVDLGRLPQAGVQFGVFLDQLCQRLGFDFAAYAGMNPVDGSVHAYGNYPDKWKAHYVERKLHRSDPTLLVASRSIAPVDWRRVRGHANFRQLFRDAHDFGIGELGLTIPVRGPYGDVGMLSVTRKCTVGEWDRLLRSAVGELQSLAVHLHDAAMQSDTLSHILRRPTLSSRETEILQWVAAGKSQQDIAAILSLSQRTVEVHLSSGREKLGALNTPQAVARAVALGIIYPF